MKPKAKTFSNICEVKKAYFPNSLKDIKCPCCGKKNKQEHKRCVYCGCFFGKPNKYNAKGCWIDGEYYDSQAEADFGGVQELLLRAGEINSYLHHPERVILANTIKYTPDYLVFKSVGIRYYVEVKGMALEPFKIKFNLYKNEADKHPPLFTVKQNRGSQTSFSIMEEYCINPHGIKMA